ncbi:MAG: prenyltransferase/squalene oxidase repeat-containing protein [Thermoguttaceae bacterium]
MLRAQSAGGCLAIEAEALDSETLLEQTRRWLAEEGPWWAMSFTFHLLLLSSLLLFGNRVMESGDGGQIALGPAQAEPLTDAPDFDPTPLIMPPVKDLLDQDPTALDVVVPPRKPPNADTELGDPKLPIIARELPLGPGGGDPNAKEILGTILPFSGHGNGPGNNEAWISPRVTTGPGPYFGPGGKGPGGFPGRHLETSPDLPRKQYQAILYALHWLARHQLHEGNWSLQHYPARCRDATCTGTGSVESETAATAMGVLPFLAAGQTQRTQGPYQKNVAAAIGWFLRHQKPDGDLRAGSTMYAHALAAIALCEAYGMTGDQAVGYAAQRAIDFIQRAQNAKTGGWRYQPGEEGDLSVVGWQVMALKSAQMAGLKVDPAVLDRAKTFIQTVGLPGAGGSASTAAGGLFAYTPGSRPSTTMTSVGLLCDQYLGMRQDDPVMAAGTAHLLDNLPDNAARDTYYWYDASQVMHNQPGPDWDTWTRKMRHALIESQEREGCATGSWDPHRPATDRWGVQGGRLMTTSLATLTLEVPCRYLPLYQLNKGRKADHSDE